jgi:hypothetical protein
VLVLPPAALAPPALIPPVVEGIPPLGFTPPDAVVPPVGLAPPDADPPPVPLPPRAGLGPFGVSAVSLAQAASATTGTKRGNANAARVLKRNM